MVNIIIIGNTIDLILPNIRSMGNTHYKRRNNSDVGRIDDKIQ